MRELGAEVVLCGHDFDAAKAAARQHAAKRDFIFVEDGRDPPVSEGAGTIAIELLRWPSPFDAVVVALGNGALVNGIGTWIKAHRPAARVIGVCASGAPAMEKSFRAGQVIVTPEAGTIADGIAIRVPVPEAVADMRGLVDDVLVVNDETILRAMRLILEHTGVLTEPSGAVGVAAILAHPGMFAGQAVAAIVCGGNVAPEQIRRWFGRVGI
jgi:threonine dehydratase